MSEPVIKPRISTSDPFCPASKLARCVPDHSCPRLALICTALFVLYILASLLQCCLVSLLLGCGVRDRLQMICLSLFFYCLQRVLAFSKVFAWREPSFGCRIPFRVRPFEFPAQEATRRHFISLRMRGLKYKGRTYNLRNCSRSTPHLPSRIPFPPFPWVSSVVVLRLA